MSKTDKAAFPDKCPITRRPFFMVIEHPELGRVPTYGGPFDSYTIPEMLGDPHEQMHERELFVRRYDHDYGGWVEDETIPLRVIHDSVLNEYWSLQEVANPPVTTALVEAAEKAVKVLKSLLAQGFLGGNIETMEQQLRAAIEAHKKGGAA